ncbi:2523_t:CDS:2, partial [Dentiscutata heterogama]
TSKNLCKCLSQDFEILESDIESNQVTDSESETIQSTIDISTTQTSTSKPIVKSKRKSLYKVIVQKENREVKYRKEITYDNSTKINTEELVDLTTKNTALDDVKFIDNYKEDEDKKPKNKEFLLIRLKIVMI